MAPHATELAWPRGLALKLENVWLRRSGAEILRGVSLSLEAGHRYVIAGHSGSGKTSMLRLLNRLDDPDEGSIAIGPTRLRDLPVRAVRRAVGMVFQNPRLLPGNVEENLRYPDEVVGAPPSARDALGRALIEVGLDADWLDRDVGSLSGGERQRLALAVALRANPEILLLDEPTSGLDPASARRVADVLRSLAESHGLRTITVTHHREHALRLGDTAIVLEAGRVVDQGPTSEVLARADQAVWKNSDSEGLSA